ncbi:uncharacterized protein [Oscarella lobularis]|uniref:uncharacterized protein n=1 Tax=Oscarella lobularis TaxID=121494 RepID=UPI0033135A7B
MSSLGSTGDSPVSSLASSLAPSLASSRESVASFGSLERHVEEEKYSKICQSIEERKYKKIFSAEKSFDESGGRIFADADAIVLSILPGALKAKTSIVISILSSCDGSEKSTIIELRPHLMAFSQSALLRVSHHASKVAICYAKDVGPYEFIGHVAEDHPRCESETMNISFNKFYIDMQMMSFCRICVTEHSSSFPASLLFFLPKSMSSAVGVTTSRTECQGEVYLSCSHPGTVGINIDINERGSMKFNRRVTVKVSEFDSVCVRPSQGDCQWALSHPVTFKSQHIKDVFTAREGQLGYSQATDFAVVQGKTRLGAAVAVDVFDKDGNSKFSSTYKLDFVSHVPGPDYYN